MRPLLFDDSALIALFRGNDRVSALWFDAEAVGVRAGQSGSVNDPSPLHSSRHRDLIQPRRS